MLTLREPDIIFAIKRFISCNIHFAKLLPGEYFFLAICNIKLSSDIYIFYPKKVEEQRFDIIIPLFIGLAIIYLTMNH